MEVLRTLLMHDGFHNESSFLDVNGYDFCRFLYLGDSEKISSINDRLRAFGDSLEVSRKVAVFPSIMLEDERGNGDTYFASLWQSYICSFGNPGEKDLLVSFGQMQFRGKFCPGFDCIGMFADVSDLSQKFLEKIVNVSGTIKSDWCMLDY